MAKKNTSLYDAQENQISAQTDLFMEMLTRRGLIKDQQIDNKRIQKARQEYLQHAFHNTETLLSNYRTLQWIMECYPEEIAAELDTPFFGIDSLVEKMEIHSCLDESKFDSRMRSAAKTRLLMDRLNEALTVLKKKPGNGEELYYLIYCTYIQKERWSHYQIIEHLLLSSRKYYRLRKEAIEVISTRLWATPNGTLDTWFEVLALVEEVK